MQNLLSDQPTVLVDTDYQVEIRHTPYSVSDIVLTRSWSTADASAQAIILRNEILTNSPNVSVQNLQFRIRARHNLYGTRVDDQSTYDTEHLVTPDSTLTGQVAMGQSTWGTELPVTYAAVSGNLHTVTIGTIFGVGDVEYKLNSGSWIVVIAQGATSGTFTPSTSDVIHLRHTASDGSQTKFIELKDNGVAVSYGLFLS